MSDRVRFDPVQPVRAYQRIVEQVEEAVFSGRLKPGERLPSERELMTQFAVSRSTVREALRVLESGGMVRSRPGDPNGPELLPLSSTHLETSMRRLLRTEEVTLAQLVQFRMLLDGSANLLAARLRNDAQLAEMESALDRMEASLDGGTDAFSEADVAFHDVVARASGNMLIQVCLEAVRGVVVSLIANKIAAAGDRPAVMRQSLAHHREVLDAVREGDGVRAARAARAHQLAYYAEHVDPAERQLLEALVDSESAPPPRRATRSPRRPRRS